MSDNNNCVPYDKGQSADPPLVFIPLRGTLRPMKAVVTSDSTQQIVLTKDLCVAAGIATGQRLQVTASPGFILIAPVANSSTQVVQAGQSKVFTGDIPEVDLVEAVTDARNYTR